MSKIELTVYKITNSLEKKFFWSLFYKHHYLSADLNLSAECFVGFLWGNPVAFYACLRYPSGTVKNAIRGHRLVVLPDYQGMGIGGKFCETIGQYYINFGFRFFAKTANIKLGRYRNNSSKWRPTSKNMKKRKDVLNSFRKVYNNITKKNLAMRLCYSHEYIGESK